MCVSIIEQMQLHAVASVGYFIDWYNITGENKDQIVISGFHVYIISGMCWMLVWGRISLQKKLWVTFFHILHSMLYNSIIAIWTIECI